MLLKIMLKVLSVKAGVKKLDFSGTSLVLYFSPLHQKNPHGMIDLIHKQPKKFRFSPDQVLTVSLSGTQTVAMLGQAKNILKEIAQHVNP